MPIQLEGIEMHRLVMLATLVLVFVMALVGCDDGTPDAPDVLEDTGQDADDDLDIAEDDGDGAWANRYVDAASCVVLEVDDGADGTDTLVFESRRNGTHGANNLIIRVEDSLGKPAISET